MSRPAFKLSTLAATVALIIGSATAQASTLYIDSTNSVIHTSGGATGSGYGDIALAGSFDVDVDSEGALYFSNLNITSSSLSAGLLAMMMYQIETVGVLTYDGTNFTASVDCTAGSFGCPTASATGTYDGTNFSITGTYNSGIPNDYTYSFNVLASTAVEAVPVPASMWLFGSGLLGMTGLARRRNAA